MNEKYPQIDELLSKAANVSGNDRSRIDALLAANPQVAAMLAKMKQSDIDKVSALLSDKAKAQQILASPKAQQILRSLKKQ